MPPPILRTLGALLLGVSLAGCGTSSPNVEDCGAPVGAPCVAPTAAPVEGRLESGDSVARFAFTVLPGRSYRLSVEKGTLSEVTARLLEADGRVLGGSSSGSLGGVLLSHWSVLGGTFLLEVSSPGAQVGGTFTYHLQDVGVDETGDSLWSAAPRTPSAEAFSGRLDVDGDLDVYAFSVAPGHLYSFQCSMENPPSVGFVVSAVNARGELMGLRRSAESPSSAPMFLARATSAETWFAGLYLDSLLFPLPFTGPYSCRLEDLGVDDHGNTLELSTRITPSGEDVVGVMERLGDVDVFSARLLADHYYRAACLPGTGGGCEHSVLGPSGASVAMGGATSDAVFKAPTSGLYSFVVSSGGGTGSYTYRLTHLSLDDHGNTPEAATPLDAAGASLWVRLDSSLDEDFFSFTAEAGRVYRFRCDVNAERSGWELRLERVGGGFQDVAGPGLPRAVSVETSTAGTYTVRVRDTSSSLEEGAMSPCSLEDLGPEDHGDTLAAATALTLRTQTTALLETRGDVDVFSLPLEAGRAHLLDFSSSDTDITATLSAPDGSILPRDGEGRFTPTTTGTYFIQVRVAETSTRHPTGSYRLNVL